MEEITSNYDLVMINIMALAVIFCFIAYRLYGYYYKINMLKRYKKKLNQVLIVVDLLENKTNYKDFDISLLDRFPLIATAPIKKAQDFYDASLTKETEVLVEAIYDLGFRDVFKGFYLESKKIKKKSII